MATKKIELKVHLSGAKGKAEKLQAVAALTGVDKVEINEEKGIVTVVWDVDPVELTKKVRNPRGSSLCCWCRKSTTEFAHIVSVGPPKKEEPEKKKSEKAEKKKPEEPPKPTCNCGCGHHQQCHLVAIGYEPCYYNDGFGKCTIL